MYKAVILKNLKGRVYPVNLFTALAGLDGTEGMSDLDELVKEGKVEAVLMPAGPDKFDRPQTVKMYRAIPEPFKPADEPHLKLIK